MAISYEPELLLARDQGAAARLRRRDRPDAADLADARWARRRLTSPAELRGKSVGTAGIPYQAAYLKTILQRAGVPPRASSRSTSASTSCRRCSPGGSRRRSARSGTTRASSSRASGKSPSILRMERLGVPTYNELIVVARQDGRCADARRRDARASCAALGRGYQLPRDDPRRGRRRAGQGQPRPRPRPPAREVKATLPVFFPADAASPSAGRTRAVGRLRRLDAPQPAPSRPPNARAR